MRGNILSPSRGTRHATGCADTGLHLHWSPAAKLSSTLTPVLLSIINSGQVSRRAAAAGKYFITEQRFCTTHLHELGSVEREGEESDRDHVHQHSLGVGHRLGIQAGVSRVLLELETKVHPKVRNHGEGPY